MAGKEIDEGEPSQQSRAGDPAPGIASSSSANGGIQEEALKADLSASTPRHVAAGGKKKPHQARAKGKNPGAFARVWSVEDDVRILECLAGYVKLHGEPPARAQLREVVVGQVVDQEKFTLTQIYEKVRRLRNEYDTMRSKAAAGAPPLVDAEELSKYELCRQIWGDRLLTPKRETRENGSGGQAPKARVRRDFEELQRLYPYLAVLVEEIAAGDRRGCLKRAFELMDDSKACKLDAKVKKLRVLEMQTQQDRRDAQTEVLSMLLEDVA